MDLPPDPEIRVVRERVEHARTSAAGSRRRRSAGSASRRRRRRGSCPACRRSPCRSRGCAAPRRATSCPSCRSRSRRSCRRTASWPVPAPWRLEAPVQVAQAARRGRRPGCARRSRDGSPAGRRARRASRARESRPWRRPGRATRRARSARHDDGHPVVDAGEVRRGLRGDDAARLEQLAARRVAPRLPEPRHAEGLAVREADEVRLLHRRRCAAIRTSRRRAPGSDGAGRRCGTTASRPASRRGR